MEESTAHILVVGYVLCFLLFLFLRSDRFKGYIHLRKFPYGMTLKRTFKDIIKEIQPHYTRKLKLRVAPKKGYPFGSKYLCIYAEANFWSTGSTEKEQTVLSIKLDPKAKIEDIVSEIICAMRGMEVENIVKRHMEKLKTKK